MVKIYPGVTSSITNVDDDAFQFLEIFADLIQVLLSEKALIGDSEAVPTIKAFLANSGWPRTQQELFCNKLFFLLNDAIDAGKQFNLKEVKNTKKLNVANARLTREKDTKLINEIILENLIRIWPNTPINLRNSNRLSEKIIDSVNKQIEERKVNHKSLKLLKRDAVRKRVSAIIKSGQLDNRP
jgi:hypothetical protein